MIDTFGLALVHALLLVAAWRLLARPDLDHDEPQPPRFGRRPPGAGDA